MLGQDIRRLPRLAALPDYEDAAPLHRALVAANPDRLVWGSDWPHPQIDATVMPNDGRLLNLFLRWTPDAAIRRKILVDNPTRLYGFPAAQQK